MKKLVLSLMVAIGLISPQAQAAQSCFSSDLVNAEQIVRLHSELMVVMLTCRQSHDGRSLRTAYSNFTNKNLKYIREAEQGMMAFYREEGVANPEGKVDKMRTVLANEYAQQAADESLARFCERRADKVVQAATWSTTQLQSELETLAARYSTDVPSCSRPQMARAGQD